MRLPPEHRELEQQGQPVLPSLDWLLVTVAALVLALLLARTIAKRNACQSQPAKKASAQST